MGVNANRYPKLVEREVKKGTRLETIQKMATMKPDRYDKPSRIDKYILKKLKAKQTKKLKGKATTRTKQITGGLKSAGLSDTDIARLRGK